MYWFPDAIWGVPLILATVLAHCFALFAMGDGLDALIEHFSKSKNLKLALPVIVGAAVVMLIALIAAEATVWAAVYVLVGSVPSFPFALLYSFEAMTTYGHASVSLEPRWQMLGALEALNGIVLLGLTTAFLFSLLRATFDLIGRKRAEPN